MLILIVSEMTFSCFIYLQHFEDDMLTDDAENGLKDILDSFEETCIETSTTFKGVRGEIAVNSLAEDCDDLNDVEMDDENLVDESDAMKESCSGLKSLLGSESVCFKDLFSTFERLNHMLNFISE